MAIWVRGVEVPIRAQWTQLEADMKELQHKLRGWATQWSNDMSNALSPKQIEYSVKQAIRSFAELRQASTATASELKLMSVNYKEVAKFIGLTEAATKSFIDRTLKTRFFEEQEKNLKTWAKAWGMSTTEIRKAGQELGMLDASIERVADALHKTGTGKLATDLQEIAVKSDYARANMNEFLQRIRSGKELEELKRQLIDVGKYANVTGDEIRTMGRQMGMSEKEIKSVQSAIKGTSKELQFMQNTMRQMVMTAGAYFGFHELVQFGKDVFKATQEVRQLNISMEAITGSSQEAASEMAYVRDVADQIGLNFYDLIGRYKNFAASARAMNISIEDQHKILLGLSKASATYGLASQQVEGAFLAIEQMAAKGTLSMEEVRRQLGDHLPGAMTTMARSVGMTNKEFIKFVESGEAAADYVLPKFADELLKLEGRLDDSIVATNKASEAWKDFKAALGESGFQDVAVGGLQLITLWLNNMADALKGQKINSDAAEISANLRELESIFEAVQFANEQLNLEIKAPISVEEVQRFEDFYDAIVKYQELASKASIDPRSLGSDRQSQIGYSTTTKLLEEMRLVILDLAAAANISADSFEDMISRQLAGDNNVLEDWRNGYEGLDETGKKFIETLKLTEEQELALAKLVLKHRDEKNAAIESAIRLHQQEQAEIERLRLATAQLSMDSIDYERYALEQTNAINQEKYKNQTELLDAWNDYYVAKLADILSAEIENNDKIIEDTGRVVRERIAANEKAGGEIASSVSGMADDLIASNKKAMEGIDAAQSDAFSGMADDFHDIFIRSFDNDVDGLVSSFEDMGQALNNLWKRALLEMAYQAIAQPIIVPIYQSLMGTVTGATGATGTGSSSSIGSMLGGVDSNILNSSAWSAGGGWPSMLVNNTTGTGVLNNLVGGTAIGNYMGIGGQGTTVFGSGAMSGVGYTYAPGSATPTSFTTGDLGFGNFAGAGMSAISAGMDLAQGDYLGAGYSAINAGLYLIPGAQIAAVIMSIAKPLVTTVINGLIEEPESTASILVGASSFSWGNVDFGSQMSGDSLLEAVSGAERPIAQAVADALGIYADTAFDAVDDYISTLPDAMGTVLNSALSDVIIELGRHSGFAFPDTAQWEGVWDIDLEEEGFAAGIEQAGSGVVTTILTKTANALGSAVETALIDGTLQDIYGDAFAIEGGSHGIWWSETMSNDFWQPMYDAINATAENGEQAFTDLKAWIDSFGQVAAAYQQTQVELFGATSTSGLDTQVASLDAQFSAWIDTLDELGFSLDYINTVEAERAAWLEKQTDAIYQSYQDAYDIRMATYLGDDVKASLLSQAQSSKNEMLGLIDFFYGMDDATQGLVNTLFSGMVTGEDMTGIMSELEAKFNDGSESGKILWGWIELIVGEFDGFSDSLGDVADTIDVVTAALDRLSAWRDTFSFTQDVSLFNLSATGSPAYESASQSFSLMNTAWGWMDTMFTDLAEGAYQWYNTVYAQSQNFINAISSGNLNQAGLILDSMTANLYAMADVSEDDFLTREMVDIFISGMNSIAYTILDTSDTISGAVQTVQEELDRLDSFLSGWSLAQEINLFGLEHGAISGDYDTASLTYSMQNTALGWLDTALEGVGSGVVGKEGVTGSIINFIGYLASGDGVKADSVLASIGTKLTNMANADLTDAFDMDDVNTIMTGLGYIGAAFDTLGETAEDTAEELLSFTQDLQYRFLNLIGQTLEASLYQYQINAAKELATAQELGADLNMLAQVQGLEKLKIIADYYDSEADAAYNAASATDTLTDSLTNLYQQANTALDDFSFSIQSWMDSLEQSDNSNLTPKEQLDEAYSDFWAMYEKAAAGDRSAMGAITQYADRAISANWDYYASSVKGQEGYDEIVNAMTALPDMITAEEYIAQNLVDAIQAQTDTLTSTLALESTFDTLSGIMQESWGDGVSWSEFREALANNATAQSALAYFLNDPTLFDSGVESAFLKLDTNHDGILTTAELSIPSETAITDNSYAANLAMQEAKALAFTVGTGLTSVKTNTRDTVDAFYDGSSNYLQQISNRVRDFMVAETGQWPLSAHGNVFTEPSKTWIAEAGSPEAAVPLIRGPNGDLGVQMWSAPAQAADSKGLETMTRLQQATIVQLAKDNQEMRKELRLLRGEFQRLRVETPPRARQ